MRHFSETFVYISFWHAENWPKHSAKLILKNKPNKLIFSLHFRQKVKIESEIGSISLINLVSSSGKKIRTTFVFKLRHWSHMSQKNPAVPKQIGQKSVTARCWIENRKMRSRIAKKEVLSCQVFPWKFSLFSQCLTSKKNSKLLKVRFNFPFCVLLSLAQWRKF